MKVLSAALTASLAAAETLCTLVKITQANGAVIALADHDADVTLGGITYTSTFAFEISSIAVHSGTQNSSLELSMLLDPTLIDRTAILSGTLDKAKVEVSVCDYTAPGNGAGLYYAGRIHQISFTDDITAVFQVNSLLDQNVQAAYEAFSYTCTADLGDARCKADIAGLTKTFTVTEAEGSQAFFTDLTDDNAFWNTGLVQFTSGLNENFAVEVGQYTQENGAIVLRLPVSYAIAVGDKGTIFPGCDKTPATCLGTYNNIANYRGIPVGVNPALGAGLTAPSGAVTLPPDQQPPGKIGLYSTLDGSFAWIGPDQLPVLPLPSVAPPGYQAVPAGSWLYSPVSQFPVQEPSTPPTYETLPSGQIVAYNAVDTVEAGNVIYAGQILGFGAIGYQFPKATDDATAYGFKFKFNGYVLVYTGPATTGGSAA